MKDFTITITVKQTPAEVFDAINNVKAWWQGEIEGDSHKVGDEFSYRMNDIHYSKQKLVELMLNKKVVWLVTDSKLNFVNKKTEWTGTKVIFDISAKGNKTQLQVTHQGLTPTFECYDGCSGGWTALIEQSLHSLITTGKATKVF
jgi:hypothetical protein